MAGFIRQSGIKRHRLLLLLISGLFLTLLGCVGGFFTNQDASMSADFPTQPHCFGRYTISLPSSMELVSGYYRFENFELDIDKARKTLVPGLEKRWQAYVANELLKTKKIAPKSKLLHQDMKYQPKNSIVYYDTSSGAASNDPGSKNSRLYEPYYLMEYKEPKIALMIMGNMMGMPRSTPENEITSTLQHQFNQQLADINQISYQPWPHSWPGYCLSNEFAYYPQRLEKTDSYSVTFRSNNSYGNSSVMHIDVDSIEKGGEQWLADQLGKLPTISALFAGTSFTIDGRKGDLFIARNKLNPASRDFRWYARDTEVGNRQKPLIMIRGKMSPEDFPIQYQDTDPAQVIYWVLNSMKIRPGSYSDF